METKLANSAIISLFRAHMIMSKKTKVRQRKHGQKGKPSEGIEAKTRHKPTFKLLLSKP
jgi:hypothetical protein